MVGLHFKGIKRLKFSIHNKFTKRHEKKFESLFIHVYSNKKETLTVGTIHGSPQNDTDSNKNFLSDLNSILID